MQDISSPKKSVKPNAKLNLLILRLGTFISLTLLLSGIPKAAFSSKQEIITQNSIPSTPQAISTDKLLQAGITQLREYKLRDAEKTFQQLLARRQKQQDSLGEAEALNYLGEVYNSLGEYPEAQKVLTPALAIYQKLKNRQGEGNVLDNLGENYQGLKEYSKALETFQKALAIRRETNDKKGEGETLTNISVVYIAQGKFPEAVEPLQESLKIRQQIKDSFSEPETIALLGLVNRVLGKTEAGLELLNQALQLSRQVKNPRAEALALTLNGLVYQGLNKDDKAIEFYQPALIIIKKGGNLKLFQDALEIRRKTFGAEHPDVAGSLNNIAVLYKEQGNYTESLKLFQAALKIHEKKFGFEHYFIAQSLNNIASVYEDIDNFPEAMTKYQRALEIRTKVFGSEHYLVAQSYNNLAGAYGRQGKYAEAIDLYQKSLKINQKVLGNEHPIVAQSFSNIAVIYDDLGNYREAENFSKRALAINEKIFGQVHPKVAINLNNLATLYYTIERYSESTENFQIETLIKRALDIQEKIFGSNHPDVALSLNNLSSLYNVQGKSQESLKLLQRSLAIYEKNYGTQHTQVAINLSNQAWTYFLLGNNQKAIELTQKSLDITESIVGSQHPNFGSNLGMQALYYNAQGDISRAIELRKRGLEIGDRNLNIILGIGSEHQKQNYMALLVESGDFAISSHLQSAPNNPQAANLALTTILRRKGRILDVESDSRNWLRQNLTPENQKLFDELSNTNSQVARLLYNKSSNFTNTQYRQEISQLKTKAENLEAELSKRSAEFRITTQPVTIEAVQKLIPTDTALVEFVQYKPLINIKGVKRSDRYGKPRYAAYILTSQGSTQWVDLGEAETIDREIAEFGTVLQSKSRDVKPVARRLDSKLMQPIRKLLGDKRKLLLSPDSQLNLIPFAALVDENNRYLVENYTINYLTTGRDLLRLSNQPSSIQPPVMMANIDFNNAGNNAPIPVGNKEELKRSSEINRLTFGPLEATKQEANAILPLLKERGINVNLLTGSQATENALKQVRSPSILHIATHGFFLTDEKIEIPDTLDLAGENRGIKVTPILRHQVSKNIENPLLRSGIALAGFNNRRSGDEDGVLTALEASSLNLSGTKLVVLSACQTGVGKATNGEGVYGLRRAFVMAGAQSQLISLWDVSDEGTKELMVKYYGRFIKNEGRSEALRQTQLEMLKSQKYQHPFYWAAFIPSGDWTPAKF
jgi:CHAT domain-containing protein/Tfp pilus assembly protein PilF